MAPRRLLTLAVLLAAFGAGCSNGGETDAGADAGQPVVDAGPGDAGHIDAGAVDAGPIDAGPVDAGPIDAGPIDAGPIDAGPIDAGAADAGEIDAGPADAGPADAGEIDAGEVDAGPFDAGPLDAGPIDAGEVDAGSPVDAGSVDSGSAIDAGSPIDAGNVGNIVGVVLDHDTCGQPLANFAVTLAPDGLSATTDAQGQFSFTGVNPNPRALITVTPDATHDAWTTHSIPVAVRAGEPSTATALMADGCISLGSFDVTGLDEDSTSNCVQGFYVGRDVTVHVEPNGMVMDDGGSPGSGAFMFFAPLQPDLFTGNQLDRSRLAALPGDFTGVLSDGTITLLFGYGQVELRAVDYQYGVPLHVASGFGATVAIAMETPPDAAAQMWSFDPAIGRWTNPQPGTYDGTSGLFTATVPQLGWVMVASPIAVPTCVRGVATDGATPLPGAELRVLGNDAYLSTVTTADDTGAFCAAVPPNLSIGLLAQSATGARYATFTNTSGASGGDCTTNTAACLDLGQLTVPTIGASCNQGVANDQNGTPITDPIDPFVQVYIVDDFWRAGCFENLGLPSVAPDATGAFCLALPPNATRVNLTAFGTFCGTAQASANVVASGIDACGGTCGDLGTLDFFCGS